MSSGLLLDIIIFGGIAALIIYRLISVLGKDIGHKKNSDESFINKRHEYYQNKAEIKANNNSKKTRVDTKSSSFNPAASKGAINKSTVVRTKKNSNLSADYENKANQDAAQSNVRDKLKTTVKPKLNKSILQIQEISPTFDSHQFIKSAAYAFELIYNSYISSEISQVRHLCSTDIYKNFKASINNRKLNKERWFHQLVKIQNAEINKINLKGNQADITVDFTTIRSEAILNKDGKVISGSLGDNFQSNETWTFSRDLKSSNPVWQLVAL